jgi:hypothetical protein
MWVFAAMLLFDYSLGGLPKVIFLRKSLQYLEKQILQKFSTLAVTYTGHWLMNDL